MSHPDPKTPHSSMKVPMLATLYSLIGLIMVFVLVGITLIILDAIRDSQPLARIPVLEPTAEEKIQLQAYPKRDRLLMEETARERLTSYGWVDRSKKIVHIPLERAMDLAVQQNWPVRTEPEEAASSQKSVPS